MDVLIDLDAAPPPDPGWRREDQPAPLDHRLLLVVGLVLTLMVPAATPIRPGPLAPLVRIAADGESGAVLHDGVLYVGDTTAMAAYQLPQGRLLWRTSVPSPVKPQEVDERTGVLVGRFDRAVSSTVQVYDLATGAPLWRREDVTATLVPGTGTLVGVTHGVVDGTDDHQIFLIDARTGAATWERTYPESGALLLNTYAARPEGYHLLATRTGPFDVEVFDVLTGVDVSAGDLRQRVPALATGVLDLSVNLVGGMLLVVAMGSAGTTLYGLDAATLTPRWSTRLPEAQWFAIDCGALVCMSGDGGTSTIDPYTGTPVGHGLWRWVRPLPGRWLLGFSDPGSAVVGTDLVSRLDLTGWDVVAIEPALVLVQPDTSLTKTWIALVDPALPARRVLGSVPVTGIDSVATDGRYLVCHLAPGPVVVYSLH